MKIILNIDDYYPLIIIMVINNNATRDIHSTGCTGSGASGGPKSIVGFHRAVVKVVPLVL